MSKMHFVPLALLVLLLARCGGDAKPTLPGDPLPSWNDTLPKQKILSFVEAVTRERGPHFVPPEERVATFDNDGCLWTEKPLYTQVLFAFDRVKELAPQHPEWKEKEPFKSALAGDAEALAATGKQGVLGLLSATHTGMTTDEFEPIVVDWLENHRHPTRKRPYRDVVYQPMLELLTYLRANGFRTYIVTGGGQDFVRPFAEVVYGIPPDQVVGTSVKTRFEMRDGKPVLVREAELFHFDDKDGKAIGIQRFIGLRPIAAFGNSDGDIEMLQWATAGDGLRLGVLIHHTDGEREVAYDRESKVGRLDRGLDLAEPSGWVLVDMKADWSAVFPPTAD